MFPHLLFLTLSGGQGGVRTQKAEAPGGAGAAGGSSRVRLHIQTSLRVPNTRGYTFNHLLSHTLFYFSLSTLFPASSFSFALLRSKARPVRGLKKKRKWKIRSTVQKWQARFTDSIFRLMVSKMKAKWT